MISYAQNAEDIGCGLHRPGPGAAAAAPCLVRWRAVKSYEPGNRPVGGGWKGSAVGCPICNLLDARPTDRRLTNANDTILDRIETRTMPLANILEASMPVTA
jgi:hypothetical protein